MTMLSPIRFGQTFLLRPPAQRLSTKQVLTEIEKTLKPVLESFYSDKASSHIPTISLFTTRQGFFLTPSLSEFTPKTSLILVTQKFRPLPRRTPSEGNCVPYGNPSKKFHQSVSRALQKQGYALEEL